MKEKIKMKQFKAIINVVCFLLFVSNCSNCLALDTSVKDHEEIALFRSDKPIVYIDEKTSDCEKCEKYLIKYDGINSLISQLEKLTVEKFDTDNLKIMSEKIGISITGLSALGLGIYFIPVTTVLTTLGLSVGFPTVCTAYKEIMDPTIKVAGFVPRVIIDLTKKALLKFFNYKIGDDNKNIVDKDRGLFGNAFDIMCGDSTKSNTNLGLLEGTRKLIFGDSSSEIQNYNKEAKIYKNILDNLQTQIKERKFENNNFLLLSTDFTDPDDMQYCLKFKRTFRRIDYPNKTEDYFKNSLKT